MTEKTTRRGPRRFSVTELKRVGVTIIEHQTTIMLRCQACRSSWSPNLQPGGKLPIGYWKCPNGCHR